MPPAYHLYTYNVASDSVESNIHPLGYLSFFLTADSPHNGFRGRKKEKSHRIYFTWISPKVYPNKNSEDKISTANEERERENEEQGKACWNEWTRRVPLLHINGYTSLGKRLSYHRHREKRQKRDINAPRSSPRYWNTVKCWVEAPSERSTRYLNDSNTNVCICSKEVNQKIL